MRERREEERETRSAVPEAREEGESADEREARHEGGDAHRCDHEEE